jgi:hypothetical protein
VVAHIRERLGIELDMRELFDCTTIARLAVRVREEIEANAHDRHMSQFLQLVEHMSDEEVEAILAKSEDGPAQGASLRVEQWEAAIANRQSVRDDAGAGGLGAAAVGGGE